MVRCSAESCPLGVSIGGFVSKESNRETDWMKKEREGGSFAIPLLFLGN